MRDIKFRAWDGKQMTLHDSLYEFQRQNLTEDEMKSTIYLQYTGVKDKNGKEIYEGDIVKTEWSFTEYYGDCGLVRFANGRFFVDTLQGDIMPVLADDEVIGNVFENPELIKRKENP